MSEPRLSSTGVLADGTQQLDINGRPISPRRRRWGMNVNIFCCGLGTLWAVMFWPGSALFILYMSQRLGASKIQIGFFAAIAGIGQIAQVLGVYIFDRTRTRKVLWVTLVLLYRFLGLTIIGFALWAHYYGPSWELVWAMLGVMAAGFMLAQVTANAWWSWIADLVPESVRGRFLANRQLAATLASLTGTLPVILLDRYRTEGGGYSNDVDFVFIGIFALCTLSGVVDIIIHAFIPEPSRGDRPESIRLRDTVANLIAPLRDASFRRFTLAMTMASFSLMIWSPFVWPYLKGPQINLHYSMFFVSTALISLGTLLGSRYWGLFIDRFGSKPVMVITYNAGFLGVYLFFITPENAPYLALIVGSFLAGLLWSGMILSTSQLMLTLAPQKTRNSYVAVHAAITGVALFFSWGAGWLAQEIERWLRDRPDFYLPTGTLVTYIQVLVFLGVVWRLMVYPLLLRVREGHEKPLGVVLATVMGASQFRTLYAMRMIAGRDTGKKLSVLRGMDTRSDRLAVEDLIGQVRDAHPHVRREAALALGRVGGPEAVDALLGLLDDPAGDLRAEAAVALGMTGDPRVIGPLLAKIGDPNEIVREHVAGALGELQSTETALALMDLLKGDPSPNVFGRGAQALAKLGVMDAVWEIVPRMQRTENVALRRQLATAVGNLLGRPGRFYDLMNEELRKPDSQAPAMVRRIHRQLRRRSRALGRGPDATRSRQLLAAGEHVDVAAAAIRERRYDAAVREMVTALVEMMRSLYDFAGQDDVAVEFALSRSSRLGASLWTLQNGADYSRREDRNEPMLRLYALLGLHAIHEFVSRWDPSTQKEFAAGPQARAELFNGRQKARKLAELRRIDRGAPQETVARLVGLLDDAEPRIRAEATLALGRVGGPEAVDALLRIVNDPSSELRGEAALALGLAGDPRAAGPLLAMLADPNEIVREHAAGALGELPPSAQTAQALMRLLKDDPSPNVFGRAAQAMARLGVMDAAWEILPRMRQTTNVGLRRQSATALGDLLGRPGEFYQLMNEELRKPGSRVISMSRRTARHLRHRARKLQLRPEAEFAPHLLLGADHVRLAVEEFEFQRYDLALQQLQTAAMEMLRALCGLRGPEEVAVEFALSRDQRLGVGLWCLQRAREQARTCARGDETPWLLALLGFHFLHAFARTLEE